MAPASAFSVARRIVFITNVNLDWTEDQLRGSVYQHTSVHVNRMQRVMEGYFFDCDSSADAAAVAKGMAGRQILRQGSPVSAVRLDGDDRRIKALADRYLPLRTHSQPGELGARYSTHCDGKPEEERVRDVEAASAPRAHSSSYWDLTPSEPKEVAERRRKQRHRRGSHAPSSDLAQPYEDFAQRPDASALYRAHLPERWQAGLAAVPLTAADLARSAPRAYSPPLRSPPAPAPGSESGSRRPFEHIRACHHLYADGLSRECAWQDLKDFARMHCDSVGYATVLPGHWGAVRGLLSFCTKAAQEEALVRLKGLDIYGVIPKWGKMHLAEWDAMELEEAFPGPARAHSAVSSSPPLPVATRAYSLSHAAYQAASEAYWPQEYERREEARNRGEPEFSTGSNTQGLGRPNRYGAVRAALTDAPQAHAFVASPERLLNGYGSSSRVAAPGASEASAQPLGRRLTPDSLGDEEECTGTKRRRLARPTGECHPAQPWVSKSASPSAALRPDTTDEAAASKQAADESGIALCPSSPVATLPPAASDAHASIPRSDPGPPVPMLPALNAPLPETAAAEATAPAATSSSAFMLEIANIFAEECGDFERSLGAATSSG